MREDASSWSSASIRALSYSVALLIVSRLTNLLFDIDKVKQKWKKMKQPTKEMLVVNFNPLRTIPLHDSAIVYPFDLFLKCADEKKDYQMSNISLWSSSEKSTSYPVVR